MLTLGPLDTMDHERWPFSMLRFLQKISLQLTKPLGPSLGVNRMWTKRNDYAPKNECADCLIYVQKRQFWIIIILNKLIKFDLFVFSCLHLLFPK